MEAFVWKRVEARKEFLIEKKQVLLLERLEIIKNSLKEEIRNKSSRWKEEIFSWLAEREEGCLVLSFLRSSYLTGSHKFLLSFYQEEPFLEENPDSISIDFYPYFAPAKADIQELNRAMEKEFVAILAAEKEEIRRWYLDQLYQEFKTILPSLLENQENGIDIYYGGFMEKLDWVGRMEFKKR